MTDPTIPTDLSTVSFSLRDVLLSLGELVGVFAVGIGLGVVGVIKKNNLFPKFSKQKQELRSREAHSRLHESLTELRVLVHASRSLIFQFHNGGKFADGTSIKRFSVTHESCATSVPSMMLESQDVLLTRYMEMVEILDKKSNQILNVDTLPHCSLRSTLEINNVVYFCVSQLKCHDSLTPMGFVCCHWCDVDDLDKLYDQEITNNNLQEVIESSTRNINNHLLHAHR